MPSVNIMDFLTDKFLSFSTKMKGDSSKLYGSSYLMSSNNNFSMSHQLSSVDLLNGLMGDVILNSETANTTMPLKQPFGLLCDNYSFSFRTTDKPFSHHLYNLVMDTYRYTNGSSESPLLSNSMLGNQLMSTFLYQSPKMNRCLKSGLDVKETSAAPETKMSVSVTRSHSKCEVTNNKSSLPNTSNLNKQLANRKKKEMLKRSKKRRRRQKKNQQFECSSSASISDDEIDNVTSAVTSCVCLVSEKAELECTLAVSHSLQIAPNVLSTFIVPVDSASDDDSEWEPYEINRCNVNSRSSLKTDSNIQPSSVSSQVLSKNTDSKCSQPVKWGFQKETFISSFIVPVASASDDESDWDSCETDIFNEIPEFEFAGLLLADLCAPQPLSSYADYSIINSDEDDETIKLRAYLQEVNKNWIESTKGVEVKQKSPSKVSFVPDEALVEVFPVEICDRKGEWEMYATERLRFKRKIDELEKILSPCLNAEHRSKVFKKLHEPTL